MKKTLGYLLIALSVFALLFTWYKVSHIDNKPRTFSPYTLLHSSWEKYKQKYITKEGRVIDPSLDNITTSEGQSYAMLRAVWTDDKKTFDNTWKFTRENLKRDGDNLFGWKWGKKEDGSYGFAGNDEQNSASDADSDIALALILATRRWGSSTNYEAEAKKILEDLWKYNTAEAAGKRYLIAGNWAQDDKQIIVNPSYFSPYAWRLFKKTNPQNDWESLINPAYELLYRSSQEPLDKPAVGLPPDWLAIEKETGNLKRVENDKMTTNYSFDAIRVPWRIAVDYLWNKEPKAEEYLTSLDFLKEEYDKKKKIEGSYGHDGNPLLPENPAMYATAIGYFLVKDRDNAKQIYENKILALYSNDQNSFDESLSYYDQNWLWFGLALYNNSILQFSDT